jgi:hypothetical protein
MDFNTNLQGSDSTIDTHIMKFSWLVIANFYNLINIILAA